MFHSQIALTKKGYSANPAWKPLTDPGDNADEDAAGSPDTKRAPLQLRWYDVRALPHPCVKEEHTVIYHGNKWYMSYECKTHSPLCPGYGKVRGRCEPSGYTLIPVLNETVVSGCRCKADWSGRKLKLKREDVFWKQRPITMIIVLLNFSTLR